MKLASAGDGETIRVWDVQTGQKQLELPARPAKVMTIQFTSENEIYTGGSDNQIRQWNLKQKRPGFELVGHTGTVTSLACDAKANWLVSGSYDTTVRVWDLRKANKPHTAALPVRVGSQR